MTRKERIVKAMKRDAEIHARGHFTADERDTIILLTPARWTRWTIERNDDDSVASLMAELVEAK